MQAARRLGVIGRPLPPPPEEAAPRGRLHSRSRDAQAVQHHYDVSNDFYAMVLGPAMTYSCARFAPGVETLEAAQESKHDLVCRKLGLAERSGQRILDVGCGWGSFALHAARHYGAQVVGVTLSPAQARWARDRVAAAGLEKQIEIRLQDYRDLRDGPFDGIASVGMFEHVGLLEERRVLRHHAPAARARGPAAQPRHLERGRLAHRPAVPSSAATCSPTASSSTSARSSCRWRRRASRYATSNPFASTTPRPCGPGWRTSSEHWDAAVAEVGVRRARVWLLYMAASANGFEDGGISIHQVLGVVPGPEGRSGMPPTRSAWG